MANDFDVIVIGSGAGGRTLAYRLAPSGLRVLLVERGDNVRRELENWSSKAVVAQARFKTKEEWICQDGTPFHPGQHYYVGRHHAAGARRRAAGVDVG
jgi:choline dehydrogenase-like flavoprotein